VEIQTPVALKSERRVATARPLWELPCSASHAVLANRETAKRMDRVTAEHGRQGCALHEEYTAKNFSLWRGQFRAQNNSTLLAEP